MKKRHLSGIIALGAAASLALTGCSGDSGSDSGSDGEAGGTITLGYVTGWTDGEALTYLTKDQLEKLGYEVEVEEFSDAGVLYAGLSEGDFDVFPSAWPQVTHKKYMEQVGEDLEDLTAYYDGAVLTISVPEYMDDVNSIEDLKGQADRFDGKIIGIEPGAGLTGVTQDSMMPEYGLDGEYSLATSSTAAMLATLDDAIENEEDIVVTLWTPFWGHSEYNVKDLEDPKGAMGKPETLNELAKDGFTDEFPEAADLISKIKLSDESFGALEALVTEDPDRNEADVEAAVDAFVKENPDAFDGMLRE
ncbi:glycine betaine ABC transporter substrate-binding protein [Leucobacter sp. USHLN153]|uniref:glycine betaine ABC transporter substrate-binding protein n=1 Tax=Leucobacter sp. USHLN153 TaxID=3081268 RepID=UPI0030169991